MSQTFIIFLIILQKQNRGKTAISSKKRDYYFKHEFAIFNIFTFYNKTQSPSASTFNARKPPSRRIQAQGNVPSPNITLSTHLVVGTKKTDLCYDSTNLNILQ